MIVIKSIRIDEKLRDDIKIVFKNTVFNEIIRKILHDNLVTDEKFEKSLNDFYVIPRTKNKKYDYTVRLDDGIYEKVKEFINRIYIRYSVKRNLSDIILFFFIKEINKEVHQ